ncbi:DUF475 domain-containing protein [Mucilaginibacter daejeonensis]|uniref:DUF475 domain-containing protein n=1 Tax=Mucilaginibacter daejeonensis TaxID=398049 RepID=UPI001D172726|nr:DUF475 domain-containing protein [Mucilaginibacter daejeonensis]UEG51459.1 DUF475 domain-containing protein [Mucilaginibacter daejeonensis]
MDFLHTLLGDDIQAGLLIILNLIVIESLLSVDNAAVLATMVIDLPKAKRSRALKYGIVGAYLMRGLCLFLAAWLVKIWWLKPLGGLYLIYLAVDYFRSKGKEAEEKLELTKEKGWIYRVTVGSIGTFWATVALIELMDLAFSVDNVFAAVAFTDNINLIYIGVFIGILAMRFVAQAFVKLIEKFPFLENVAFLVIGILGLKLVLALYAHYYPETALAQSLEGREMDIYISVFTVAVFIIPVLTSLLFNMPTRKTTAVVIPEEVQNALKKN